MSPPLEALSACSFFVLLILGEVLPQRLPGYWRRGGSEIGVRG